MDLHDFLPLFRPFEVENWGPLVSAPSRNDGNPVGCRIRLKESIDGYDLDAVCSRLQPDDDLGPRFLDFRTPMP